METVTSTWVWYDPDTTYPMATTQPGAFLNATVGHSIDLSTYTDDAKWVDANGDDIIDDVDTRAPGSDTVGAPAGEGLEIGGQFQKVSSYVIYEMNIIFKGESTDSGFVFPLAGYQLEDGTVAFRFPDEQVQQFIDAGRTLDEIESITLTGYQRPPFQKHITVSEHDDSVPCFAAGTLVGTAQGEVRVENLSCGDLVKTMDRGYVPIAWVGRRTVTVSGNERVRPVRIRAGALGDGLPTRDLWVSQQHRMLVRSRIARRMFGADEVLVSARLLLELDGIGIDRSRDEVTYVHFMCAGHEVVFAEGAPTESLYLGPEARKMLGREALEEIFGFFPELRENAAELQSARTLVKGRRAKQLAFRHRKNSCVLLTAPS